MGGRRGLRLVGMVPRCNDGGKKIVVPPPSPLSLRRPLCPLARVRGAWARSGARTSWSAQSGVRGAGNREAYEERGAKGSETGAGVNLVLKLVIAHPESARDALFNPLDCTFRDFYYLALPNPLRS